MKRNGRQRIERYRARVMNPWVVRVRFKYPRPSINANQDDAEHQRRFESLWMNSILHTGTYWPAVNVTRAEFEAMYPAKEHVVSEQ
jgi:hypothetical protein